MYLCLHFCTVKPCTKRGFRGGLKPTDVVNHLALGLPILFFIHVDLPDCCISVLVAGRQLKDWKGNMSLDDMEKARASWPVVI